MLDKGENNTISIGKNLIVDGIILGNNNTILIDSTVSGSIKLKINGNNNKITIGRKSIINGLIIEIGNNLFANNTVVDIGNFFSIEPNAKFILPNSFNKLKIGNNCLLSNSITIRCGELPHLIFDLNSGDYIDLQELVYIGNHCWIGEKVYMTKNAYIGDENIVAACSVVTRKFNIKNSVLGGNPAKIVKKDIQWIRNYQHLEENSLYKKKYDEYKEKVEKSEGLI